MEASHCRPLDPDTQQIHSHIDEYIENDGSLSTVDVSKLLRRSFISIPNLEGEQNCTQREAIKSMEDTTVDYTECL